MYKDWNLRTDLSLELKEEHNRYQWKLFKNLKVISKYFSYRQTEFYIIYKHVQSHF